MQRNSRPTRRLSGRVECFASKLGFIRQPGGHDSTYFPKFGDRRLKPGDEVITVAAGFPTTVAPIVQNRLVPVFVDVNLGDYTAIPSDCRCGRPQNRAIMMAHTLGVPFDLDVVMELVKQHNLWLVEDNCDALGSQYRGG